MPSSKSFILIWETLPSFTLSNDFSKVIIWEMLIVDSLLTATLFFDSGTIPRTTESLILKVIAATTIFLILLLLNSSSCSITAGLPNSCSDPAGSRRFALQTSPRFTTGLPFQCGGFALLQTHYPNLIPILHKLLWVSQKLDLFYNYQRALSLPLKKAHCAKRQGVSTSSQWQHKPFQELKWQSSWALA